MLWNLIRDFFVEHIFGGVASNGDYFNTALLGQFAELNDLTYTNGYTASSYVPLKAFDDGTELVYDYISLGDWLSTTATIISITIIVVLCCLFVYKIIKLIGGLIR